MNSRQPSVHEREVQRWKDKFLNALEDHEKRDRQLSERVRVLRRGLLGVSLAADGVDERLDTQLDELRRILRKDDREAGLEVLLEKIEKAVIRLDAGKQQDQASLRAALTLSLEQLEQAPVSGDLRRRLKRFGRSSGKSLREAGSRPHGTVTEFLDLLREAVAELTVIRSPADRNVARRGIFARLFGQQHSESAALEHNNSRSAETDEASEAEEHTRESSARVARLRPIYSDRPRDVQAEGVQNSPEKEIAPDSDTEESVQGELLRDGSGLAEPAFSYIADHVEPLLLRILENIHIAEQSREMADALRAQVSRGLNWYEFVAVLESIVSIIAQSMDQEREAFQGFLSQVTENLAQVEAFVALSADHQARAREADDAMDARVRQHIDGITDSVSNSDDLSELKQAVQGQLDSILGALDGFRESREQDGDGMNRELRALTQRVGAMEQESRELREHLLRQQQNALQDKLTGLPNREAYDQAIRQALDNRRHAGGHDRRAEDRDLCLAVCDVDHFKHINDNHGHLAGDKVLRVLARELQGRLRDTDMVARYGGEEFVVILPDTTLDDAAAVMEQLRVAAEHMPFHVREEPVNVTVSLGLAAWQPGDGPGELFERADRALYKAKQNGRNRVEVADPS